jgi:hypothetical protein
MHAVNFTASTTVQEVPRRWGIVTYQFTWTNFTTVENGSLVVGDVFQGGFFFAANDSLEIEAPRGYEITSVAPRPATRSDEAVTWVGREDFATRHPRVVASPSTDGNTTVSTVSEAHQTGGPSSTGGVGSGPIIGGVLLLGLVGVSGYTLWQRRDTPSASGASAEIETGPPRTDTRPPTEQETADAPADTGIKTDAERGRELLKAHDGRMRQAAIADELDWSASKMSRVVSDLVDQGTVEKLQLGRENLINLTADD